MDNTALLRLARARSSAGRGGMGELAAVGDQQPHPRLGPQICVSGNATAMKYSVRKNLTSLS